MVVSGAQLLDRTGSTAAQEGSDSVREMAALRPDPTAAHHIEEETQGAPCAPPVLHNS